MKASVSQFCYFTTFGLIPSIQCLSVIHQLGNYLRTLISKLPSIFNLPGIYKLLINKLYIVQMH